MNILVTGGCGFIGSNFILKQVQKHQNMVLNFDKLTYAGNVDNLAPIADQPNYQFINGDICNSKLVADTLYTFQPAIIVHFAAETHVDRSIDAPMEFIQTNIVGTATLLNALLDYWQKSVNKKKGTSLKYLHVSTDEVFGSLGDNSFFTEQTPYDPSSPYSASKAGSDHLVRAWNRTYGLPTLITNCSNNYGPYQFPEKLIPLIIANCIDEKPLPLFGKGLNVRDWLYVEDHCDAIDAVLEKGVIGETYNIGGNNEFHNINIVKTICTVLDKLIPRKNGNPYDELITYVKDRPGHDFRYAIDSSKIKNDLGWAPKESFESGIRKTIQWYLDNETWWRQIQDRTYNQERLGLKKSN